VGAANKGCRQCRCRRGLDNRTPRQPDLLHFRSSR
jgi:hypothetical protein